MYVIYGAEEGRPFVAGISSSEAYAKELMKQLHEKTNYSIRFRMTGDLDTDIDYYSDDEE